MAAGGWVRGARHAPTRDPPLPGSPDTVTTRHRPFPKLGTAVDLTTTGLGGGLDGFEKTPAFAWLLSNAYRYGFVLSYPPNNQYYVFEPWHWRYVGVKLATDLRTEGKYFYDLDQREIDKYLSNIFD